MMTLVEQIDQVAVRWRLGLDGGELENPAGPLFINGRYAAAEITADEINITPACPTLQWTPCITACLVCPALHSEEM